MNYFLIIKGDYNDADFIERSTIISKEQLDRIRPLIEAIKKQTEKCPHWPGHGGSHNYDVSECATTPEELYPDFDEDLHAEFFRIFTSWRGLPNPFN